MKKKKECVEPVIEIVVFDGPNVLMVSGFDGVGEYDPTADWE